MDLGKLIEEIVPWIGIAIVAVSAYRKQRRSARISASGARKASAVKAVDAPALSRTQAAVLEATKTPAPVAALPDEGIHAIEQAPAASMPQAESRRRSDKKRRLRQALVVGELLAPKF